MSENQNRDFSAYDAMDTKDLENILRLDAETPGGEESDTELLLHVMEVLANRRNNTNSTGNNAFEAWESFQQNYLPETCLEFTSPKKSCGKAAPWLRRVIAAAAVIALVICVPVTAKAFGWEDIWNIFARWAKETFSFVSDNGTEVSDPDDQNEEAFTSLQDALTKSNRDANIVPTWVPDGYVLESVKKDVTPMQETYLAYYTNEDKVIRIRVQTYLSSEFQKAEVDSGFSEIYSVNGVDYYLFENLEQLQVIWLVDSYECAISGDLSIDEIKLMIDSIWKG